MTESFKALYRQGGMRRLYQGLPCALLNGPLIRCGSTAANSGTLNAFESNPTLRTVPISIQTFCATTLFVVWRVLLMPVDFLQTVFQVRGKGAISCLKSEYGTYGPRMFWRGSIGIGTNSFIGTFSWFGCFNTLQSTLAFYRNKDTPISTKTLQNGVCGLFASFASSICTNGIDVLKTHRQTGGGHTTYVTALRKIRETETFGQFWCRGLRPRLALDGLQGLVFSMLWKFFEEDCWT